MSHLAVRYFVRPITIIMSERQKHVLTLSLYFTAEQFLYDRNKQQSISSFLTEPDIEEDNEDGEEVTGAKDYKKPELSELDTVKLISCTEAVRNVIGDMIPESSLTEKIIKCDFNVELVLDTILKETPPKNLTGP